MFEYKTFGQTFLVLEGKIINLSEIKFAGADVNTGYVDIFVGQHHISFAHSNPQKFVNKLWENMKKNEQTN